MALWSPHEQPHVSRWRDTGPEARSSYSATQSASLHETPISDFVRPAEEEFQCIIERRLWCEWSEVRDAEDLPSGVSGDRPLKAKL